MKYYHRTSAAADDVMHRAATFFGSRMLPEGASPRRAAFHSALGRISVDVLAEGGHYTLVTIVTDQTAESELDRLGKRFLGEVHRLAEPGHALRGSY